MPEIRTSGNTEEGRSDNDQIYERVEVLSDNDNEGVNETRRGSYNEYSFVGDKLKENNGSIIRLFYNNCNGIEINRLINQKVQEHFERKEKKYLGENSVYSKFEGIVATMKEWEVNICCLSSTDAAWEKICEEGNAESSREKNGTMLLNSVFIVQNKLKFKCKIWGKCDFVRWYVGIKE